tara:strand:- start:236 stop:895 length:660 start_codon:yes stop_codon:yes gene_type:complete
VALTKFNFNSFDLTTAASKGLAFNSSANGFETSSAGSMTLIKTLTASSSANLSFVHGSSDVVLDSTYPVYRFVFTNCHPENDEVNFSVNFRDGGSSYDATKTTTAFAADHYESGSGGTLFYWASKDLAQSTSAQPIASAIGNDNDQSCSGSLLLFNPSSTTFVKHFISDANVIHASNLSLRQVSAGYCNVTAAIDAVQFTMSSGDIDSGTIKLYGIKDS